MFARLLYNRLKKQLWPTISFDSRRCLRSRLNTNNCVRCLSFCAREALTIEGRKIHFREERCAGCMACVSACPNDALANGFDLSALLEALRENRFDAPLVLSCTKSFSHHANRIAIPCVGLFSGPVLAALNAAAAREFHLDVHRCHACDNGHTLQLLWEMLQVISARADRKAVLKLQLLTEEQISAVSPGEERRLFLGKVKNSLAGLDRPPSPLVAPLIARNQSGKGATTIPKLLQQAIEMLPPEEVSGRKLLLFYFYTVEASDTCDLCPACSGMCPTGALKIRRNDGGEKQLFFTSARCSGCSLCVEFCKKGSLTLRPGVLNDPDVEKRIA